MIGPEQSSDYGDFADDLQRVGYRQQGRKKAASSITRSRSRKRSGRKGGSGAAAPIVGMAHRRQRRWSW